jgi:hypothetical protein
MAIDNSNMLDYLGNQGTSEFSPGVNYVYDSVAKEIDFTDATTLPSGVSLLRTHVRASDKFGNQVAGAIENPDGSESANDRTTTLDVSSLDASKGLDITATVVADDGKLVADGGAYDIGASGSLGSWDKQKNGSASGY